MKPTWMQIIFAVAAVTALAIADMYVMAIIFSFAFVVLGISMSLCLNRDQACKSGDELESVKSAVQFQSGGDNVETVAMRKKDFDQMMFERKLYRVALVILTISLLASTLATWWTGSRPHIVGVVPQPIQK